MKNARDFCLWLRGMLDALPQGENLTTTQAQKIREELNGVFVHEIDPSMGSPAHQERLSTIHNGPNNFLMKC